MNPGTFQGAGNGTTAGTISRYTQTPIITTSQTIPVPSGVKRIEALLVGGGGAGGGSPEGYANCCGGGGFGGAAIIEIPVTGSPLVVTIGAGGTINTDNYGNNGSPTQVVSAGTMYAEVGGGGGGGGYTYGYTQYAPGRPGRSGGGGGGGTADSAGYSSLGGQGGSPPIGNLLWSIYPQEAGATRITVTGPTQLVGAFGGGLPNYPNGNPFFPFNGSFGVGGAG